MGGQTVIIRLFSERSLASAVDGPLAVTLLQGCFFFFNVNRFTRLDSSLAAFKAIRRAG